MSTAKEDIRRMLDQLPEDATLEDIQYHLYVRQKIERAMTEAEEGKVMAENEVEEQMKKWVSE
jgi:hypothetical protein